MSSVVLNHWIVSLPAPWRMRTGSAPFPPTIVSSPGRAAGVFVSSPDLLILAIASARLAIENRDDQRGYASSFRLHREDPFRGSV